jgi:hypothetical protein
MSSHHLRILLVSTLFASGALGAAGCAVEAEGDENSEDLTDLRPELAQVNDVSILLPLPKTDADLGLLPAASLAGQQGGALLPKETYEKAFGAPGQLQAGGTPAAPPHANLRLVAVRLDPCSGKTGPVRDDATCINEMRLVFQIVKKEAGAFVADDSAVHAFYKLTRDQYADAVGKMIAARRAAGDARLGSLGPHPLIVSQGLRGNAAEVLRGIVKDLAGPRTLTRFTQFTTSGLGTAWNFSGVDVKGADTPRIPIPNVPADAKVVAFFAGFNAGQLSGEPPFSPASNAPAKDNMQLLGNGNFAGRATPEARQAAFDAAVRIENPALHSPDTTDCASCHAAAISRSMIGEKRFNLKVSAADAAFKVDTRFVPVAETKETTLDPNSINVHMFSYKGKVAGIHRRTVNESAAIVSFTNQFVLRR